MRYYKFDKQGRIMTEEVKPLATKEEVDKPKTSTRDILIQVKDLLEDLKVARSAPVKGFIFENIYKVLGSLEGAISKIIQEKTDLAEKLAKKNASLKKAEDFHQWQISIAQKLVNQERLEDFTNYVSEDAYVEGFLPCISGEIDCQIPESEMRAYCNFFTHSHIYSIAPTSKLDELSCGIGKIIVDEELEDQMLQEAEMELQLSAESLSADLSSRVSSQCSCDKCNLPLEEEIEEDHSEMIANEASAFLDKIGPAAPVDWHGLGNDPSLVVPLDEDDCCDECEMTAEEFFGEGKDDIEAAK